MKEEEKENKELKTKINDLKDQYKTIRIKIRDVRAGQGRS